MFGPVLFGGWGPEYIADKLACIDWVHQHHIPVGVYATDAGWYGASTSVEGDPASPWWKYRGDWFPSPKYYPSGIHPLGQALKADAIGFSPWIEPRLGLRSSSSVGNSTQNTCTYILNIRFTITATIAP
jgi:hypothetical protein